MEQWKTYKLSELCTKVTDGSHFSPSAQKCGYPMFSVKDMLEYGFDYQKCKRISEDDFLTMKINGCVPEAGDVLVAKDGSYLKQIFVCRETRDEAVLSSIAIFRPDKTKILPDYLCYLIKSPKVYDFISNNCVSGSALPRIVLRSFKEVELKVPSLETQNRIISILKSLDDKIILNNRINQNIEEQAILLVNNFLSSNIAFSSPKRSLADVCTKITDGSHFSPKDEPSSSIPMYSVKDMGKYGFKYGACKHISEEDYKDMANNDCVPRVGDVLVAKDGSYLKELFVNLKQAKQAILSSIAIFRPNPDYISPELLLYLLKQPRILQEVKDNYVSGSALPRIVLKDFKKLSFCLPPADEQCEIRALLSSLYMTIQKNQTENRALSSSRDELLSQLVKGMNS